MLTEVCGTSSSLSATTMTLTEQLNPGTLDDSIVSQLSPHQTIALSEPKLVARPPDGFNVVINSGRGVKRGRILTTQHQQTVNAEGANQHRRRMARLNLTQLNI